MSDATRRLKILCEGARVHREGNEYVPFPTFLDPINLLTSYSQTPAERAKIDALVLKVKCWLSGGHSRNPLGTCVYCGEDE